MIKVLLVALALFVVSCSAGKTAEQRAQTANDYKKYIVVVKTDDGNTCYMNVNNSASLSCVKG